MVYAKLQVGVGVVHLALQVLYITGVHWWLPAMMLIQRVVRQSLKICEMRVIARCFETLERTNDMVARVVKDPVSVHKVSIFQPKRN